MIKKIFLALLFFTIVSSVAYTQTVWVEADGSSYKINAGWIADYFALSSVSKVEVIGVGTKWVWAEMTKEGDMYILTCNKSYSLKKNEFCFRITTDGEQQCFPEYVRIYNSENPQNQDPRLATGSYKMNDTDDGSNFTKSIIF